MKTTRLGGLGGVLVCFGLVFSLSACSVHTNRLADVNATLDGFHKGGAQAEMDAYVGRMSARGVFLGTDASERWTREEFRAFCKPYFDAGRGWEYVPQERHIAFSRDGRTAWFDEILTNESYGTLRGSGVLTRRGKSWEIEQYNLAFVVPNDVARQVVEIIAAGSGEVPEDP